jgi:Xaa-Pro aminopeptidase
VGVTVEQALRRLAGLRERLQTVGVDAALLLHARDVFYYAGTMRPAALLVTRHDAVLLVRRGLESARREAAIGRVEPMRGLASVADACTELGLVGGVLGTELDVIAAHVYRRLVEVFDSDRSAADALWSVADISALVLDQRAVKDAEEIATTRRAAAVADAGHSVVRRLTAPGVTELELAAEVERAMRRAGHEGFLPQRIPGTWGAEVLLMSGENLALRGGYGLVVTGAGLGPAMPYGPSHRRVRQGDLVVVDTGSTHAGYTADESRTYAVGPATASQRAVFEVARAAHDAVLEVLRPGATGGDLYAVAENVVARGAPPLISPGSLVLPGFVGHGVGLEADEPPVLWPRDEVRIRAGMVLAIEIEVSLPDDGLMAKLEDTVVVCASGCEMLTGAPQELIECSIG